MHLIHTRHTFAHRGLLYPARPNVPHLPAKKPIPTGGDTSAKKQIFRPVPSNNRTTKDWTAIAWPTNIQSGTPDGMFGPAKQMQGWKNCWFLASLAAIANNKNGQKILAESIKEIFDGYAVTFKGLPNDAIFISKNELQAALKTEGGDADTRLMELAANTFFYKEGSFKSMYIATLKKGGKDQAQAEQCFEDFCQRYNIEYRMNHNPMRGGSTSVMAFFMFTGMYPTIVDATSGSTIQQDEVKRFLKQYVDDASEGGSVVISGVVNPLGASAASRYLVRLWDMIRTEITSGRDLSQEQLAFLKALAKWLETRDLDDYSALLDAAENLNLEHSDPHEFANVLFLNESELNPEQFNLLRSGVLAVLSGRPGYIGFTGKHGGTIEGINEAAGTFTYCEPHNPELVHTGELSNLIQAATSGNLCLTAIEPTIRRDEGQSSEHAGTSRGRRLMQIHNQVVNDGKIDQAESGPLANLMEMDAGAFRQLYDSDKNGVIEGDELKAVQLRVNRWVDHLESTPIW